MISFLAPSLMADLESAIKKQNAACLLFYKQYESWLVTSADAVEVSFCTGMQLTISRKHLMDEPTSLIIPDDKLDHVIQRLHQCGNPVALIDNHVKEIRTLWPPIQGFGPEESDEVLPVITPNFAQIKPEETMASYFRESPLLSDFKILHDENVEVPF